MSIGAGCWPCQISIASYPRQGMSRPRKESNAKSHGEPGTETRRSPFGSPRPWRVASRTSPSAVLALREELDATRRFSTSKWSSPEVPAGYGIGPGVEAGRAAPMAGAPSEACNLAGAPEQSGPEEALGRAEPQVAPGSTTNDPAAESNSQPRGGEHAASASSASGQLPERDGQPEPASPGHPT